MTRPGGQDKKEKHQSQEEPLLHVKTSPVAAADLAAQAAILGVTRNRVLDVDTLTSKAS